MKVVILAGGRGRRMRQSTARRPKALVPVAGKPIIQQVMEVYARQGFTDFLIAGGYRHDQIARWAAGLDCPETADWSVEVVNTGPRTASASRLARVADRIEDRDFFLTWCDGLADVDLRGALDFHQAHRKLATVTAVHPPERFGLLELDGAQVTRFREKPRCTDRWVNGAYFVLRRELLDRLETSKQDWETGVMNQLSSEGELMAWRHSDPWLCMDTPKDQAAMEEALRSGLFSCEPTP